MKTLVIIPSRMSATRLPGKPLLKINGKSIISHVFKRAESAEIGEVVVATEDIEIVNDIKNNGGNAILTSKNHKTGTDRVFEALNLLNKKDIDLVMNVQGDEPDIDNEEMYINENVVKVKIKEEFDKNSFPLAQNFMRNIETENKTQIFHHIGIYCYEIQTLKKFVNLSQTQNELKNRLEQLRAMDNNIDINVALANRSPIGVDTMEDYLAIKKIMEYK